MKDPVQLAQLARSAAQRADWAQAQILMAQALQLAPEAPALHLNYGNILKQLGRYDEARIAYEQALHWQPDWADAHYNLGNLALLQHNALAATEHYRATLDANPAHAEAHYNLATLLTNLGRFAPAHEHFAAALRLKPEYPDALHNLGRLYRREGELAQARAHYLAALRLNPEHHLASYSLGTLSLLEGKWQEGWQGYESRWQALYRPYPNTPLPRWSGEVVNRSARLLVIGEQGFGDMLQFVRFLPQLLHRFAQVTVLVPDTLQQLLQQSLPPEINVVTSLSDHSGLTHHIPLMSLAAALQIDEAKLDGAPYLHPDPAALAYWRQHLPTGFKAGLAWQGNPQQADNRWRSIPLAQLQSLLDLPGIHWCNLQYGAHPAQLRDDCAEWCNFADTAAYIANLDLVVSSCTSIVHLAGALGVPTLLLSRVDADWRWQTERSDSPWYSSLRILRQPGLDDWSAPVQQAAQYIGQRQQSHATMVPSR